MVDKQVLDVNSQHNMSGVQENRPTKNINLQTYLPIQVFAALVKKMEMSGYISIGSYSNAVRTAIESVVGDEWDSFTLQESIDFLRERNYSMDQIRERKRGRKLRMALRMNDLHEVASPGPVTREERSQEISALLGAPDEDSEDEQY